MNRFAASAQSSESPFPAEGNLRRLVGPGYLAAVIILPILSGLLLSAAFAPLEWDWLVWVGLLPLLLLPVPRRLGKRLLVGYLFGLAHFLTSLYWLNTIGFAAGVLLALFCAVFPMCWYLVAAALSTALQPRPANPVERPPFPPPLLHDQSRFGSVALVLLLPAAWVTLEWLRSWVFTGFSWNQLGVSQWQRLALLRLTCYTGVYGLSFLVLAVNAGLAWIVYAWHQRLWHGRSRRVPWPVVVIIVCLVPVWVVIRQPLTLGAPDTYLTVAGIQGNIPQNRQWSPEQLDFSLEVYDRLTRVAAAGTAPQLIVWPETAIPAPVRGNRQYAEVMYRLFKDLQTPMLIGSIDYRPPFSDAELEQYLSFNTAFLFDGRGNITDSYDKIHLVPFGEFVPFAEFLPWLEEWIGMGRGLTGGTAYTVMQVPGGIRAGVNICYEDAYPYISRNFVQRGADLLMTLTNDAWYAESAGSRQHMVHAVLRAVENRRPLFRSGNNSDTCLILPNGEVAGLLYDPGSGSRFVRGFRVYEVPVWRDAGFTFYSVYGDVFAWTCAAATAVAVITLLIRKVQERRRLLTAVGVRCNS
jgi:apolipoprotein N-acyltransferase